MLRFTQHMLIAAALVALVPLLAGVALLMRVERLALGYTERELVGAARAAGESVIALLDHRMGEWRALAGTPEWRDALRSSNARPGRDQEIARFEQAWWEGDTTAGVDEKLSTRLRSELRGLQGLRRRRLYGEVGIADARGGWIAVAGEPSDYDQSDEDWWRIAMSGETYVGPVRHDESSGTVGVLVAAAVQERDGTPIGVVGAQLDADEIARVLEARRSEVVTRYLLIDQDGRLIIDTARELRIGSVAPDFDALPPQACQIVELPLTGWRVVALPESSRAAAAAWGLREELGGAIVGSLLLSGLVGIVVTRPLRRRLWRMRAWASDVAAGLDPGPLDERGDDELAEFARRFEQAARQLRRATEAAHAAARSKSAFLASVSHEMRTPLTAVMGYADLLRECRDPATVREHAEAVDRHARSLLRMIDEALEIGRQGAASPSGPAGAADPFAVAVEASREVHVHPGVRLEVVAETPLPPRAPLDSARVRRVLLHLLENASRFTERGSVEIAVALERRGAEGPELIFEVRDTGLGIAPGQRAGLFGAPATDEAASWRSGPEAGLGLVVGRECARAMGGELTLVRSAPGRGSVFRLSVPLAGGAEEPVWPQTRRVRTSGEEAEPAARAETPAPPASDEAAPEKPDAPLAGVRVLIVEDGVDNRRLIDFFLRRSGAETAHAEDGRQGLDAVLAAVRSDQAFGLIIMDMQMPVMDGYEATARLREAGVATPILALTAHAMVGDRERCLAAGCDDYATKPIERAALVQQCVRLVREAEAAARTSRAAA